MESAKSPCANKFTADAMLDDLNFGNDGNGINRPPSRQKDPALAVGMEENDELEEDFPSNKIILTSEVPVPLPPDAFNDDGDDESGEFE